ncbi:MAG TPA: phosphoribosylpyrophosphate synthetase [Flavisolibacter sp.]|nr:phosphoribosylpyrophosphate synthetase [Flavisolibacter sp.]
MYSYGTVSEAINDLKKRGFTEDFNLAENCLMCNAQKFNPDDFEISEVYRFEGDSNPDDEAIVYGIESKNGIKGVLVNAYGYQSNPVSDEIVRKLRIHAH